MTDELARNTVVVAGLGSEYRRDDGAGLAVAHRIAMLVPSVGDVGPLGEPLDLLGRWDNAELVVVIDTVRSGAVSGTVTIIDLADDGVSVEGNGPTMSTHGIGLIGALRIAHAIDRAPSRVVVVAIEGADFGLGVGLSPTVERAVTDATEQVLDLLGVSG